MREGNMEHLDLVSLGVVTEPYGNSHPAYASIVIDGHIFVAEDFDDWSNALLLASEGVIQVTIPNSTIPGETWIKAAKRFAAMVTCSCGKNRLDPESEGFRLGLCDACLEESEWENTHSDYDHEHNPDPGCPLCQRTGEHDGPRTSAG